ncbi:hypothetical protein Adt_21276 [Abeliophyllum distichum]|uniref:Uncharacterized protein n=1 Tax=Abeliophyllum distichum TaxID=126358 RepID=A0ABD1SZ05_9LAMI
MSEASSSFSLPSIEGQEDVDQGPTIACPPLLSMSRRGEKLGTLLKAKAGKGRHGVGVLEMRGSLDKRDVSVVQQLDEELKRLATAASMVRSKIREVDLEDIRLSSVL